MIDLHTHTSCSDGTDKPSALINKALSRGIKVLAITDHDSIDGWDEAIASLRPGLDFVPGAEISCMTEDGISVHMLGLLFDRYDNEIIRMLNEIRDNRIPRALKMIKLLNEAGIDLTMEEVESVKPVGATLGRPHIADAMVKRGLVASREAAFKDLLNNNSKFYVPQIAPRPIDAISKIRSAGGVAVIAHPFASLRGRVLDAGSFRELAEAGLNGIEVDHRDHNSHEKEVLRGIAKELNLVVTGSSDYHGTGKLNTLGENSTDPAQWELLEALANGRRVVRK